MIGVIIIVSVHTAQQVVFGQYPRGGPLWPLVSTTTELAVATLLARYLERRDVSAVRIAIATCLATVAVSTAFSLWSTVLAGLVGIWRTRFVLVGAVSGLQVYGFWVLALRYPLLVDEARVRTLEMERVRQAAELARLREHLQPHFLRNTLNAIAALVTEDPAEARNLLAALGDLLSESMEDAPSLRTLGEEIDWLQRYAEILEARYRGSISFTWDAEPAASNANVPRLLLQPLLENAIHHGALARDGDGHVIIRTRPQQGGGTTVEVIDNGPGFDLENPRKNGLGLSLVRRRVETEARGALRMESDSSGTRAIVELP